MEVIDALRTSILEPHDHPPYQPDPDVSRHGLKSIWCTRSA
jgi:hypothetical protein